MSLLEDKANKIVAEAKGENPVVFVDPITILTVISVIVQIVKLYQSCKKTPEEVKKSMESPNWIERWRLKRIVRKSIKSNEDVNGIVNGILKQGKDITVEEIVQLQKESEGAI